MRTRARAGVAGLLVLLLFAAPAASQEEEPSSGDASSSELSTAELIRLVSAQTGAQFIVTDPSRLDRHTGLTAAIVHRMAKNRRDWFSLLGTVLSSSQHTFHRTEIEGLYRIVRTEMIFQHRVPVVSEPDELPDDAWWGAMVVHLRWADPNSVQRALLSLVTRPGGVIQPISGANAVIVTDSRDKLEMMREAIRRIDTVPDTPPMTLVRGTIGADRVQGALGQLRRLFQHELRQDYVRFTAGPPEDGVVTVTILCVNQRLAAMRAAASGLGIDLETGD